MSSLVSCLLYNDLQMAFMILLADNENSENPLTADGKTESAIASGPTSDNENTKDSTISEDKNTSMLVIIAVL